MNFRRLGSLPPVCNQMAKTYTTGLRILQIECLDPARGIVTRTLIAMKVSTALQNQWGWRLKSLVVLELIRLNLIFARARISMTTARRWRDQMVYIFILGWRIHPCKSWGNVKVIVTLMKTVCLVFIAFLRPKEKWWMFRDVKEWTRLTPISARRLRLQQNPVPCHPKDQVPCPALYLLINLVLCPRTSQAPVQ